MKQWAKLVILFGIDGAGTFFEQARTPNIDRIFKNGAMYPRALTELPSISAECWGSILHGVECRWHGLTNWVTGRRPYPKDSPYPSVFRVIREQRPDALMASFCDWNNVNTGIIEDGLGVYKVHAPDRDLVLPAEEYISAHDFTLIYFHFDSVDGAGHAHGYGTPEHLRAIEANDGYIGAIVSAVEKRGWLGDTLILVTADHGGTPPDKNGRGFHGGDTDAEKYVCFYAAGGGARHVTLKNMMTRDTAPIILHALGLEIPDSWNSRVPGGLFPDIPEDPPRPAGLPPAAPAFEARMETGRFKAVFGDLKIVTYLPFEVMSALPEGAKITGKLYPSHGVRGRGARFDDGALSVPCPVGDGSFTLTGWARLDIIEKRMPLMGLHCPSDPASWFYVVATDEDHLVLTVRTRDAVRTKNMETGLPLERTGVWMFLALSFDADRGVTGFSLDFQPFLRQELPGKKLFEKDQAVYLYLGADDVQGPGQRLPGTLDDVCVFKKALDDGDIARLKKYYRDDED